MKLTHGKIAAMQVVAVALIGLAFLGSLSGCGTTPTGPSLQQQQNQAQAIVDAVSGVQPAISAATQAAADIKTVTAAATQPIVVTNVGPGGPTSVTVPAPAAVVKAAETVNAAVDKITPVLTKISAASEALVTAQAAIQQAQQTGVSQATVQQITNAAVQAAVAAGGAQYTPYIALGGMLGSLLLGLFATHKGNQTAATAITSPGVTPGAGVSATVAPPNSKTA